jgi:hypothetical protein
MSKPITLVSRGALDVFSASRGEPSVMDSLQDVEKCLAEIDGDGEPSHTLDLTGHTRRGTNLLAIGRDTLDLLVPAVERAVTQLVASGVLRRLRIRALRLLGCETAVTPVGQRTIKRLAGMLEMPVYGTRKRIGSHHYNTAGFASTFDYLLIESADLPTVAHRLPLVR